MDVGANMVHKRTSATYLITSVTDSVVMCKEINDAEVSDTPIQIASEKVLKDFKMKEKVQTKVEIDVLPTSVRAWSIEKAKGAVLVAMEPLQVKAENQLRNGLKLLKNPAALIATKAFKERELAIRVAGASISRQP